MAKIESKIREFKASNPWGIRNGIKDVPVSKNELITAAIQVGAVGLLLSGNHGRPRSEMMWRIHSTLSCLEEKASRWEFTLKDSLTHDPTERAFLGYQLGSVQAQIMSRKILGLDFLVHLDVLGKLDLVTVQSSSKRPDYIGFKKNRSKQESSAIALVEAKGTAAAKPIQGRTLHSKWKAQVKNQSYTILSNIQPEADFTYSDELAEIVSSAGFNGGWFWQSMLADPVNKVRIHLDVEMLSYIGHLCPIANVISTVGNIDWSENVEKQGAVRTVLDLGDGITVELSMKSELCENLVKLVRFPIEDSSGSSNEELIWKIRRSLNSEEGSSGSWAPEFSEYLQKTDDGKWIHSSTQKNDQYEINVIAPQNQMIQKEVVKEIIREDEF